MGRGKTILIAGAEDILSAAIQLQLEKLGDAVVITPEEANERGLEPLGLSFQQRIIEDFIATNPLETTITDFNPPMTRRERRAQNRKKR